MLIKQAVYQFRHFSEDPSGYVAATSSYSDLALYDYLKMARSQVVKSILGREMLSPELYQTLSCIELEEVDRSDECPSIPKSGCMWLRSTKPVPDFIHLQTVSSPLGNKKYNYRAWDRVDSVKRSRIPSAQKSLIYTFKNQLDGVYLYIYNDEFIKTISGYGVTLDPVEAAAFCSDKTAICDPMNLDFHTPEHILELSIKIAYQTILRVRASARQDRANDDASGDKQTN